MTVEPKVGDPIINGPHHVRILRFDDDFGTQLNDYSWVDMAEFEKNEKGVWVRTDSDPAYKIGDRYPKSSLGRAGTMVIRPAVFEGGKVSKVITTSPCCPLNSRRLSFDELLSVLGDSEGWLETCAKCDWHYRVWLEYTDSPRLGLYGVRWKSMGY